MGANDVTFDLDRYVCLLLQQTRLPRLHRDLDPRISTAHFLNAQLRLEPVNLDFRERICLHNSKSFHPDQFEQYEKSDHDLRAGRGGNK